LHETSGLNRCARDDKFFVLPGYRLAVEDDQVVLLHPSTQTPGKLRLDLPLIEQQILGNDRTWSEPTAKSGILEEEEKEIESFKVQPRNTITV
jgi:hypothetical protein